MKSKAYVGTDDGMILDRIRSDFKETDIVKLSLKEFASKAPIPSLLPKKSLDVVMYPTLVELKKFLKKTTLTIPVVFVLKDTSKELGLEQVEVKPLDDRSRRDLIKTALTKNLKFKGSRGDKIKILNLMVRNFPKKHAEVNIAIKNFLLSSRNPYTLKTVQENFGGMEKFWTAIYDFLSDLKRVNFINLLQISESMGTHMAKSLFIKEVYDLLHFRVLKETRMEFKIRSYRKVNLPNFKLYTILSRVDRGSILSLVEFVHG